MWAKIAIGLAILYCSGVHSQVTINEDVKKGKFGQSASISCQGRIDPFDESMAFYRLNTERKDDITDNQQLTFWGQVELPHINHYSVEVKRSPDDRSLALYKLTVESLVDTDDGYYMCAVIGQSTKEIKNSATAEIIVLQPVQVLNLKIGNYAFNSDRVNENIYKSDVFSPVTLTCEASGSNPKPIMQIKIGGSDVTSRAREEDRVSVIGTFPNQARQHTFRLRLTLRESDAEKDIECIASVKGLTKRSKVAARVVVSKPPQFNCKNVTAQVGDRRVKLICTVTYNPRIHSGAWVDQKTQRKIPITGKATADGYTGSVKPVQANPHQTQFVLEIFEVREQHFNTLFELQVNYSGRKVNKVLRLKESGKTGEVVDPNAGVRVEAVSVLTLTAIIWSLTALVRRVIIQQ